MAAGRRHRKALGLSALFAVIVLGCSQPPRPTIEELRATLPTEVDGQPLDLVQIVDDSFLSGHPLDDVLGKLGKHRDEASALFLESSLGTGGVGAAAVDGVDGTTLLEAVLETWGNDAVVARSQETIRSHTAWLIVERDGYRTYVYASGRVVYFAQSANPDRARSLAEALP